MPGPSAVSQLWRWVNVVLRGLHLVSVILLGGGMLGAQLPLDRVVIAVAATGGLMFALDVVRKPAMLREVSGCAILAKLALIGGMAWVPPWREPLFWVVVAGSAVFAHAPAAFRHARLF